MVPDSHLFAKSKYYMFARFQCAGTFHCYEAPSDT